MDTYHKILQEDCLKYISEYIRENIDLSFVDPPFNQGKEYRFFDDSQPEEYYWEWLEKVLSSIYEKTVDGGSIYFMQREKNTENVLRILRKTGWVFQNLIIWKKKTSAVPSEFRFSKQYQIIAFATKKEKPKVFNRLRIDLPIPPGYRYERDNGVYVSDIWDDIRELTSGYFAGDEAIRDNEGKRVHTQQSPIALLLRIILSSSLPGDTILDPFAGTGTTMTVAKQLGRNSINIEIDPENIRIIEERFKHLRSIDDVSKYYEYYKYTQNLEMIWPRDKIFKSDVSEQMRFL